MFHKCLRRCSPLYLGLALSFVVASLFAGPLSARQTGRVEGTVVKAVDGVSFTLRQGQRLALVGESGSGKSTLATALMGMTKAPGRVHGGHVYLAGRDLLAMNRRDMRMTRL